LKRYIFLFLFIFCISLSPFAEEDAVLRIGGSVSPKSLSRGQEGKIILKLTVQEGLTVNPQPSFSIEFSPCEAIIFSKEAFTDADLDIEILEEMGEEYLNLKDPVEIPFTVSPDAEKGKHLLEGKIKYFVCSKEEGWCLKSSSKFSVSVSISE
jgi:hypothetical protein